ncbi:cytochrome c biogenesis protein CcsA [Limnoglobus roseus]|uniref:Cytochrome C biogenesis protein n=1 Tax=Limnoglobus roseus TaxID=2598579 RepID=A0A5C1ABG7_9BACT|nr:cytochrome c biogenesis protein CcsA [Limnoglobus roseus]QEL15152.1 cytochrome C biogenesis protein [Limnoglobus roseus]
MSLSTLQGVSHTCFGLSYLLAFTLELARIRWPRTGLRTAGLVVGAVGLFTHSAYLAIHHPSLAAPYGSLLLLAWVLAVFYFYGSLHHARQAWGIFVLPVVLGLVALSLVIVSLSGTDDVDVPVWLVGEKFWGAIHGLLLLLAAVGLSVAFLSSVMYLVQARRLRTKANPLGAVKILSLERLEEMSRRAVNLAFPMLTAGVLLGMLMLNHEPPSTLVTPSLKVLGSYGLILVVAMLVYMRYAAHVSGRRLAVWSILAFVLLVVVLMAAHPFVEGGK